MKKLHYASIKDFETWDEIDGETLDGLINHMNFIFANNINKYIVYLFSFDNGKMRREHYVIVTTNTKLINKFLEINRIDNNIQNIFLQEYNSFESAYQVALDMQEAHKLCYKK